MKFLFLFLLLTSSAVADDIRNYNLGITARAGTVDDIKGLVVTDVTPGLRGDNSGLSVGDVLIGYRSSDAQNPEANPFVTVTPESFPQFPPTYGHMDLRYQVLAHRPSLDRTSIITLYIGGLKNAWPAGSLGVTVTQRPERPPARRRGHVPLHARAPAGHPGRRRHRPRADHTEQRGRTERPNQRRRRPGQMPQCGESGP